jgi:hypothetical protein
MGEVSRLRRAPSALAVVPALAVALGLLALGAVLVDRAEPTVLHQAEPGGPVVNWAGWRCCSSAAPWSPC